MEVRSEEERDILKEIGNIGGGNALTSLSIMLNDSLELEVPECRVVKKNQAGQLLAHPQALYCGIAMTMTGNVSCMLALLLNRDFTKLIVETLDDEPVFDVRRLSDMQKSAICEVGNIMGNSYVTAISTLLNSSIVVSVPSIVVDTGERVLRKFLDEYSAQADDFLFINNSFSYLKQKLDSYMLLCPTDETFEDIIQKLMD